MYILLSPAANHVSNPGEDKKGSTRQGRWNKKHFIRKTRALLGPMKLVLET